MRGLSTRAVVAIAVCSLATGALGYTVALSPEDDEIFGAFTSTLSGELATYLAGHARASLSGCDAQLGGDRVPDRRRHAGRPAQYVDRVQ